VTVFRRAKRDDATRTARLVESGWRKPWGWDHPDGRWTVVGPAGGPTVAVDPAGLLTPAAGRFSIDWWIGADDRWRLPASEPSTRQRRIPGAPAVETAVRVPGGDAVQRCWAVPGAVVIEVENRSPSPFALAFALRPLDARGAGRIDTISIDGTDVVVDGEVVLVLPTRAGRMATSSGARGDVADTVLSGGAGTEAAAVTCAEGLASAAVVLPVAHRTSVRVAVPLRGRHVADITALAGIDDVVRGWAAQERVGLTVDLPDGSLLEAIASARRALLVLDPDEPGPAEDAALVVAALGAWGRHAEAEDIIRSLWARERTDGSFDEPGGRGAPGGPHLWALASGWTFRPDRALVGGLREAMTAAAGWIEDLAAGGRLREPDAAWAAAGAAAAGAMAGEAGLATLASTLFTLSVDDRLRVGSPPDVLDLISGAGPVWPLERLLDPSTLAAAVAGHTPSATAAFLVAARRVLVAEPAPGHAEILPAPDPSWLGHGVEVHRAPLRAGGVLSYAIRWHGSRPALLWEVDGAPGPVRLTTPGYDRRFLTVEPTGDALLEGPTVELR
jgi:hypothetical protein